MKRLARLLVHGAAADAQLLNNLLFNDRFLLAPGLREDAVGRAVVGDGPLVVGGRRRRRLHLIVLEGEELARRALARRGRRPLV